MKFAILTALLKPMFVTPCVGVWIEISVNVISFSKALSLPAWECGLKFISRIQKRESHRSLPAWECGLKFLSRRQREWKILVTPCVGVWIEITCDPKSVVSYKVTPCVGVWIEISTGILTALTREGHSLRGSVD